MYCVNCGKKVEDGANFCVNCGTDMRNYKTSEEKVPCENDRIKQKRRNSRNKSIESIEQSGQKTGKNITLCSDGKYRWVYELSLLRNPTVFLLVWKIFFFIFTAIFAITMIADALQWSDFFPDRFLNDLKILGYFVVGMTIVVGLGYFIYAAIMGWKYVVEFEMNEKGINHSQIPAQAKKAKKIGMVTAAAGTVSGRFTVVGAGINSTRTSMYSDFSKMRKVKLYPKRNLIKISGMLDHNQVYAEKEDFEFVSNFILTHCNNLK